MLIITKEWKLKEMVTSGNKLWDLVMIVTMDRRARWSQTVAHD